MNAAMFWLTLVLAMAAVASAVFTFVQAKSANDSQRDAASARDESRSARDEARTLATEANAAFIRQAEAQEESNRLAKAALPAKAPAFTLGRISEQKWRAENTGSVTAENAQILVLNGIVHPEDDGPRDLQVGDGLHFITMRTFGSGAARIAIVCEYLDEAGEHQTSRNELTLP